MESRYQVLGRLATGGMGEILLARRLGPAGFEKLVVLKRPLAMARGSSQLIEALIDEARLLARINHPNVCQVHDLEQTGGEFFLALEYLEGLSLWAVLGDDADARPVDPRMLCALFVQACDGLDAIHNLRTRDGTPIGAVHRDISPGNLFITETGTLKILDLGIAKTQASEDRTPFGNVKGKMPYVSPEQARGKPIDARSDLFSLGLVLYDVARGTRPSPHRVGALAHEAIQLDTVPPAIAAIVRTATAVDVSARFASARDMRAALHDVASRLGGLPTNGELADWLTTTYATQLADRKHTLGRAVADATETTEIDPTQIVTMRSALGDEPHPALLSRETEQLDVPDAAPRRRRRSDRRTWIAIVVAAAVLAIVVSVVVWPSGEPVAPVADIARVAAIPPDAADDGRGEPAGDRRSDSTPVVDAPPPSPAPAPPAKRATKARRPEVRATGSLTVDSHPYAKIWLGTRYIGDTPLHAIPIAAGQYRLHASIGDGQSQDVTVTVETGQERRVPLHWSAR